VTTEEYLLSKGVSMADALAFVMSNLDHPEVIYNVAMQYGVTSSMLADIVKPNVPNVSAAMVEAFFTSNNLNGSALNGGNTGGGSTGGNTDTTGLELLPDDMSALASLVTFNQNGGALSTASLRAAVMAQTGQTAYNMAFTPDVYYGGGDGTFTGDDLGIPNFPAFAATQENLESIYYGTLIKAFKAIDMAEIQEIGAFVTSNQAALQSGNEAVLQSYLNLMIHVFEDPAATPIMADAQLADAVVMGTAMMVEVVGSGDAPALFDGMFMGLMGG
jgi:hypothetical protein